MHAREAAPEASVLKLGFTHPLPMRKIAQFAAGVQTCLVIEEGDPYLADAIRAAGIAVERQAGDVPLWRTGRGARASHSARRHQSGTRSAAGQAAATVRGLFATGSCLNRCVARTASWPATSAATRWERCRRMRRWIPASAWGRAWGGTGFAPCAAAGAGAPRGQHYWRQHFRSQRHQRAGGDGLQSARRRPRGDYPRQLHHRHDRPPGTSRHRPQPRAMNPRPGGAGGPGAGLRHPPRPGH